MLDAGETIVPLAWASNSARAQSLPCFCLQAVVCLRWGRSQVRTRLPSLRMRARRGRGETVLRFADHGRVTGGHLASVNKRLDSLSESHGSLRVLFFSFFLAPVVVTAGWPLPGISELLSRYVAGHRQFRVPRLSTMAVASL